MSNPYAAGCAIGYNAVKRAARYYAKHGRYPPGASAKLKSVMKVVRSAVKQRP